VRTRLAIGSLGVLGIGWGLVNLLLIHSKSNPVHLAIWLAAAAVLNDVVLVPIIGIVGLLAVRWTPRRIRAYVQGGLIAAGMATAIAIPLAYRQDTQPRSKALLQQNYLGNLAVIVAVIAVVTAALIGLDYLRGYRRAALSAQKNRPASDHSSST
jgi:type IV secretory pathway VirB2 component (pilin)